MEEQVFWPVQPMSPLYPSTDPTSHTIIIIAGHTSGTPYDVNLDTTWIGSIGSY